MSTMSGLPARLLDGLVIENDTKLGRTCALKAKVEASPRQ